MCYTLAFYIQLASPFEADCSPPVVSLQHVQSSLECMLKMGDLVYVSSEHIILGPIEDLFKDILHRVQLLLELLMSNMG